METRLERRRAGGDVDFSGMYVVHDAIERDLDRLNRAVGAVPLDDPALRRGWQTFRHHLEDHHLAEDKALWPPLREKLVGKPAELSVLREMEAEHARIDPLLAQVDAALEGGDAGRLTSAAAGLRDAMLAHLDHEEEAALPLVARELGQRGWNRFGLAAGRITGLRGAPAFVSWLSDDDRPENRQRVLDALPEPARLLYRSMWARRYAATPRWPAAIR